MLRGCFYYWRLIIFLTILASAILPLYSLQKEYDCLSSDKCIFIPLTYNHSFIPSNLFFSLVFFYLWAADAIFLKEEMEMFRLQGDQQAKLVVDEIKSRSLSTQKLLENRLREEVEVTRRLGVKNKWVENVMWGFCVLCSWVLCIVVWCVVLCCVDFSILHSHTYSKHAHSFSLTHTYAHTQSPSPFPPPTCIHTYDLTLPPSYPPSTPTTPSRDTDAALREASEERGAYLSLLEEARFSISHLQDELTDAR